MSQEPNRTVVPSQGGVFNDLSKRIKLIIRLMRDSRVNPLLKLLPIGTLIYFISPLDIAIGPIDDVAIVWLGSYLFVELCPPEVVEEHMAALTGQLQPPGSSGDEIIEGEYWENKP